MGKIRIGGSRLGRTAPGRTPKRRRPPDPYGFRMLHHVTLETTAAGAARFAELLGAIGFAEIEPPPSLSGGHRWFERGGGQVHLAIVAAPVAPPTGHAAFVATPFDPVLERLAELGFEVDERRRHWGARRVSIAAPDGHRVELMEAPPDAG